VRYRTLLLDLDGTLLDSEELILSSYRHTMRVHLGASPPDERWLETMGRPARVQLEAFARSAEEREAMFRTYVRHNREAHDDLIRPYPGVRRQVERLHGAGVRMAIVTSKRREPTLRGLQVCGFRLEWFRSLVTASDVRDPKPHPEPVRRALEEIGEGEPGRSLFLGDSVWDLRAGRAAGTGTAAALWGPGRREVLTAEQPDHWLARIEEVAPLVGEAAEGSDGRVLEDGTGRR